MDLRQLGKYEIVAKIGQGAMGEVFKAHDPILGRDVAIKTMTAAIGTDEELRKRFHREAQSAARLSHPNIITIFDFGEDQGKVYMAMELLEGSDLKDLIGRHTPMSLDQKLGLMEQICDGLAFAHAKEVVHRDLKPANLHIHRGGQIKIMDFGLAKLSSSEMTKAGMIMGTPNYMSPEQVRGEKATARSDVFSLGAVFYELLSNRKPFEADSLHAVLFQVMQNEPEPLSSLVPDIPPALQAVVERAMSKDPGQRFKDAGEMREALRPVRSALAQWADATIVQDTSATVVGTADLLTQALPVPESIGSRPPTSHPSTPLPTTDGAVALEPEGRGPADTVAPRQPSTLSGRASTQVPAAAPATPVPQPPPPAKSQPLAVAAPPPRASRPMPAAARPGATEPMRLEPGIGAGASSKMPLFAGGAIVAVLAAVGVYLLTRPEAPAPSPSPVPETSQAAVDPAIEGYVAAAQKALAARDLKGAVEQAGLALQKDSRNAAAREVLDQARAAQTRIDAAAAEARRAVEAKDMAAASRALEELARQDPSHPSLPQLREALSGTFRVRAEQAQAEMKRAQRDATQARATSQAEFKEAILAGREAEALLGRGEFVNAAQKFQQARDAFTRAQEAQRAALVPTPVVVAQATPPPPASTVAALPTPPPPTLARTPPPTTAATVPPAASEEPAIRRLIADFDRAFETGDVTLWRSIRVGASESELKSVAQKNWKQVNITIESIDVLQTRAIVRISRNDVGADGKTYPFAQTLTLMKEPTGWKITSLGR